MLYFGFIVIVFVCVIGVIWVKCIFFRCLLVCVLVCFVANILLICVLKVLI